MWPTWRVHRECVKRRATTNGIRSWRVHLDERHDNKWRALAESAVDVLLSECCVNVIAETLNIGWSMDADLNECFRDRVHVCLTVCGCVDACECGRKTPLEREGDNSGSRTQVEP